jgi:predicted phage terminase large subunit-like protein
MSDDLRELLEGLTDEQIIEAVQNMPQQQVEDLLAATEKAPLLRPRDALEQAQAIDPGYRSRPHLVYLADRLRKAIEDVENGISRYIVCSMPPRSGKSQMGSVYFPVHVLSQHPDWPIGLISHDPSLAVNWGRDVRALVEENAEALGVELAGDAGAAAEWKTTEKGGVLSRSIGQSITGRGFKVLIVDDAVKDFADAHSAAKRKALWNWWTANASTRQNGPWLVLFIGTRWHEDDVLGRLLSPEFEGDTDRWEVIRFPAIAEEHDVLGREPGEPLLSPLMEETSEQALERWESVKRSVGSYNWNALYQQRPSSPKGAIFDIDWWRFWTRNAQHVSRNHEEGCAGRNCECPPDGKVVMLPDLSSARWLDSWDMAFKATDASDYVVGQRWAQMGALKYLIHQDRKRMTFTQTLSRMRLWADTTSNVTPYAASVYERLVEDKANGTAVIDTLKEEISGLIAVNPTESKEARARAVTPDAEAGNVLLPYPGDPGNEWVADLLSELRDFPSGAHDDQVDSLTQALSRMRTPQRASISQPGKVTTLAGRRRGQTALAQTRSYGAPTRRRG